MRKVKEREKKVRKIKGKRKTSKAIRQEGKESRSKKRGKRLWKYNIKGGGKE